LAGIMGLVLAIGAVEWWAGYAPRYQMITDGGTRDLVLQDGIPTWHSQKNYLARWNLDCARGGRADVVILGSSIFHGVELDPADSLGPQLAALLDKGEEQPCVVNLAQPGSAFENQAAALRQHAAALSPRVVVWELWGNSAYRFTLVDDAAFNFGALGLEPGQLPSGLGLPGPWNQALFRWSAAYRFVSLSLTDASPVNNTELWRQFKQSALAPTIQQLHQQGTAVLLVFTPPLAGPFATHTVRDSAAYSVAADWASEQAVPTVDLALAFGDTDPASLRIDRCCHYNEEGTRRVAQAIAGPVRQLLD